MKLTVLSLQVVRRREKSGFVMAALLTIALMGCAAAPPAAPPAATAGSAAASTPEAPPAAQVTPTQLPATAASTAAIEKGEATTQTLPSSFVQSNIAFGISLLQQTAQREQGNVFLSPSNVSIALAMTANGAQGDTFAAMRDVLAPSTASLETFNAAYRALQEKLTRSSDKVSVSLANALWAKADVSFNDEFLNRAQTIYEARIDALDFSDPGAVNAINNWVRESTNGKIDGIVEKLDPELILLLTSAIYFKAAWQNAFDPASTLELPFTLPDGAQKQVPMMLRTGEMQYLKTDNAQLAQLAYADEATRMTVLLPDAGKTADDVLASLTAVQWQTWQGDFGIKSGTLYLPRFKAETDVTLNDALSVLGLTLAFDAERADFSGMRPVPPQVFISNVRHKAFIEVNEEGTEAAAATSVGMGATSAEPASDTFEMLIDRPFVIMIEDIDTGLILFAGLIREP